MRRIIYKNNDNSVCIIAPADGCGLSIEQIAQKDVPAGTPYEIVDADAPQAKPSVTAEHLFVALRAARDARLMATDKCLLPDYPISADALEQVKAYRTALRDLPDQPGAPWDGGGELTPWPELPEV